MKKWLKNLLIAIAVLVLLVVLLVAACVIIYNMSYTNIDGKFVCKNDKVRLGTECIHKLGRLNDTANALAFGFGDPDRFLAASKLCNETNKCIEASDCYNNFINFDAMCETMHYSIGELNGCFKKLEHRFYHDNVSCLDQYFNANQTDGDCAELRKQNSCIEEEVVNICGAAVLPTFKKFDKAAKESCDDE